MIHLPKASVWDLLHRVSNRRSDLRWKGDNLWDYWFSQEPHRFYHEVGPHVHFYENWEQDIDLLSKQATRPGRLSNGHGFFQMVGPSMLVSTSTARSSKIV